MNDGDLKTFLKTSLAADRPPGSHPGVEELEAFHAGDLAPAAEERIREHLGGCPECVDLVLALDEMEGPAAGEASPEETEGAWTDLQKAIQPNVPEPRPARGLQLLAAVLALAVAGLAVSSALLYRETVRLAGEARQGGQAAATVTAALEAEKRRTAGLAARGEEQSRQLAELRRDLDAALQPRINTLILDLAPRSPRGAAEPVPEISRETDLFTLVLEPEDRRSFPAYSAEIRDARGKTLWTLDGLTRTEFGNFTLTLARRTLPAGEVYLRLYGVRQERRTELGSYVILIQSP